MSPRPLREWWLVVTAEETDVCDADPGYDVTVSITTKLRSMVQVWRGDRSWTDAVRSGDLDVQGPQPMRRAVPGWFTLSIFAGVPRPATATAPPAAPV